MSMSDYNKSVYSYISRPQTSPADVDVNDVNMYQSVVEQEVGSLRSGGELQI